MKNLTDIIDIKTQVLLETAKHAFAGDLEDTWRSIPYDMLPGTKPQFRCCVYHERAIVKERVRLAMGQTPSDASSGVECEAQMVHVIPCACEGCPITKITVTQNCRGCLAKKCVKACPFGAISTSDGHAVIDKSKCRECGRCVSACPFGAIVDVERPCIRSCAVDAISIGDDNLAVIDTEKCVNCGHCVVGCPFGAISDISMMTNVIRLIMNREHPIYAVVAPSIEGQFSNAALPQIKDAIRALGFDDVIEAAYGADIVAYHESKELIERVSEGKKLTTSCCPAFVNLIQKHFPQIAENVSTTVSPMVAAERYLRVNHPECHVVFIGPCIAKKKEAASLYSDEIDAALTFEELHAMFLAKGITFGESNQEADDATKFGKGFAVSGGVTNAVEQVLAERDIQQTIRCTKCTGAADCKKTLTLMKFGKLSEDFVEGMYCEGGCIGGPAKMEDVSKSRRFFEKRCADNEKENVTQNVIEKHGDQPDVHRHEKTDDSKKGA